MSWNIDNMSKLISQTMDCVVKSIGGIKSIDNKI